MTVRRRLLIASLVAVALALAALGACLDALRAVRAAFHRVSIHLDPLG
jgi:hypothetical protein